MLLYGCRVTPYYSDDYATVYHASAMDVLTGMDRASVSACITDPPYTFSVAAALRVGVVLSGWSDLMNASSWYKEWFRAVWDVLTPEGALWTFTNTATLSAVTRAALDSGMPLTSVAVWDKECIGVAGPQALRSSYELVVLMAKERFLLRDRGARNVIRLYTGTSKPHGHPAQKPVRLMHRLLTLHEVPSGGTVLDPYAGSGTVATACKVRGVRSVSVELDERWCETTAKRLAETVVGVDESTSGDDDVTGWEDV